MVWVKTGGRKEDKRSANMYLFLLPCQHAQMDVVVMLQHVWCGTIMVHQKRKEEKGLWSTCISTLFAGKSPAHRQEFPGKGCHCQCSSTGIGAGGCWHHSWLFWCSSTGRGDVNSVGRMLSKHHQADCRAQGNIFAVDVGSDRVQWNHHHPRWLK